MHRVCLATQFTASPGGRTKISLLLRAEPSPHVYVRGIHIMLPLTLMGYDFQGEASSKQSCLAGVTVQTGIGRL